MRASTENPYDFRSRMGDGKPTKPEELLGAAHAGCFSMALALELTKAGSSSSVRIQGRRAMSKSENRWSIHRIDLEAEAWVPDSGAPDFEECAPGHRKELSSVASLVRRHIHVHADFPK
jgi:lipoyl-dependent peroxiredoxin